MIDVSKYLDPARPVRRSITFSLIIGGAVAGAIAGLVLTPLGKLIAGAPPVPLWRTIVEPLTGALLGAGAAVLLGSGPALLVLTPLGAAAAAVRLAASQRSRRISGTTWS